MSNLFKHASRQLRSSRKALIVLSAIVLYAVPFLFFKGFSEGAAYIKFDGIDGESLDKDHKGWSDLLSFGFGISRQTGTDGKVFPKVEIEVTGITKPIDKSTPILMTMCANPDGLPTGSVEYSKEIRGERQTYLKLELKDVIVSSYQFGASMTRVDEDLIPVDAVSLNFREVTMTYIPFDPETGDPMEPVVGVCRLGETPPQ